MGLLFYNETIVIDLLLTYLNKHDIILSDNDL